MVSLGMTTLAMQLFDLLTNPYLMTALLVIGLIGLSIELFHPGFVAPGVIGIFAFILYFYSHLEAGFGNWVSPALFILAVLLIMLELIIPGFGVFGISGIVLLFYAIISAASSIMVGLTALVIGLVLTIFVLWILVKFLGMKIMWNRVVLISEQKNEEGYRSSEDRKALLGQIGTTITPLRPAGIVQFEDRKEDVVSEREMIPANMEVVVIHVEGSRVVVRRRQT